MGDCSPKLAVQVVEPAEVHVAVCAVQGMHDCEVAE